MIQPPEARCPVCVGPMRLERTNGGFCAACARAFGTVAGLLDLRVEAHAADYEPAPLARGGFSPAFELAARGATFKAALEGLLLALDDAESDRLMQILREARGSWFPLLRVGGETCLFLGNALSGSVTPLANAGFHVTIIDRSAERARFAELRNSAHAPGATRTILGGDSARLPFADESFDLVVQEDGLPDSSGMFAHTIDECLRVARGEIVLTADNRLAYKRSTGRRSDFRVPGPIEFLRHALHPARGERTLRGYQSLLAQRGFERPRAFALYPHARDFTHVVGLDAEVPTLTIGPMERKNRLKLAARSIGLFPVLTPSFAFLGARARLREQPTRLERILAHVAAQCAEPCPRVEQVVGTRGNTIVIHTARPGIGEEDPRGRWTLHIPLSPKNVPQLERHYRSLELVRARFQSVPVPEPLVHGRIEGVWLTCERRLPGWTAPQFSGDRAFVARMFADAAQHLAALLVRAPAPLTASEYEVEIGARFDLVAAHAAVPSTITNLARLRAELAARLVGQPIARVLYHADLRAKHVQQARDGRVIGYLDWGTTEFEGLPYFDLLHLVVHQRKQERLVSAETAWKSLLDRATWRDDEREALDGYCRAVGLGTPAQRAIEGLYPVLVAAMAEKNWDYSRPRWLHRQFGL